MTKNKTFLIFLLILASFPLLSQNYVLPLWDVGNDNFAQKRNFLLNTSFTSRYNFNDRIQVASQLVLLPVMPNIQAKVKLWDKYKETHKKGFFQSLKFGLTSVHSVVFPHMGFNLLGRMGLIEPLQPTLRPNLTMNNEVILSFYTNASKVCNYTGNKINLKAGLRNTFGSDSTIVLPQNTFWYLTSSTFKNKYLYYLGLTYDAKILNNLNLSTTVKWIKVHKDDMFLENTTFFYFGFGFNKRSTIAAGYIADISGRTKQYSIMPAFNVSYKLKKRNGSDIDKYLKY